MRPNEAASVIDGVLLLGFGGVTAECCGRFPTCPGRVECFVGKVLGDDPALAARVTEVAAHYHELGSTSPYNPLSLAQAAALEQELARRGRPMPVRCGFRNYRPWYSDGLDALATLGCRRIATLVLAPQRCRRSWEQYQEEARAAAAGRNDLAIVAEAPWWGSHPGYATACAAHIATATADWSCERFQSAALLLTAHAIPVPAERGSPYRAEVDACAAAVAAACGHPAHTVAFQSAPSPSRIPWSAPDLDAAVDAIVAAGHRELVVQAIGFLVDHVEVLYDLDHGLRAACAQRGLGYTRAVCVHDHPAFITALADTIPE